MFSDRMDAGARLATLLKQLIFQAPLVVLALPRGGVPVGYEVARAFGAPLHVLVVRKLGAPGQPELGMGAIVDGGEPQVVLDEAMVQSLGVSAADIARITAMEREELLRRRRLYAGGKPMPSVEGRDVIVVDDGVATGGTARAALMGLRQAGARRLVLAVPVGPAERIAQLESLCDEVICLSMPFNFAAVGQFYDHFGQVSDEEVIRLLAKSQS